VITGSVSIDIRGAPPGTAHQLVGGLPLVPSGVRVLLDVGALPPDSHLVRLIREHSTRLHVDVRGDQHVVGAWVCALQSGDVLAGVVP
jgi:hypothetical protein